MIGFFSLNVPAGLTLYWFANNILSTAQTVYLRKTTKAPEMPAGGAAAMPMPGTPASAQPVRVEYVPKSQRKAGGAGALPHASPRRQRWNPCRIRWPPRVCRFRRRAGEDRGGGGGERGRDGRGDVGGEVLQEKGKEGEGHRASERRREARETRFDDAKCSDLLTRARRSRR